MNDKHLFKYRELLEELPKIEAQAPQINAPVGMSPCACGKKFIPMSEIKVHKTPYCQAIDTICNECCKEVRTHVLIVCTGCKTVVARFAPHVDKSGFVWKASTPYHTPYCPNCQPDCASSPVAEKYVWDQEKRK